MSGPDDEKTITVALLGNPNTGKSTLFSALCGVRQRAGNYPGVTVEKKIGSVEIGGRPFELIDLPGTYSLAPRSPDEMVAVDVLLGAAARRAPPDVVLCIVDASNLERNLYLVSQAARVGPARRRRPEHGGRGRRAGSDAECSTLLRDRLGVLLVPTQAHRQVGLDELKQALRPPPPANRRR